MNSHTLKYPIFWNLIFPKKIWNFGIFFEKFEKIRFFDHIKKSDTVNTNSDVMVVACTNCITIFEESTKLI